MTRIGIVQTTSGIDPAANAETLVSAVRELARDGAEIIFTPEMCGALDKQRERLFGNAATEANDIVLAALRAEAKTLGLWIEIGSLAIKPQPHAEKLANRSFLIDADGEIAARYDKIHLFDVDLGEGERYSESRAYLAGENAAIADTPAGKLGITICYDMRFPRLYDALSEAGAEIFSVPAAFTRPTGEAHWHLLLRTRAVENTAFVVAAAQTGEHEDGRATYGHSLVVDPWGEALLDMGTEPGTATCDIDMARIADIRRRLPSRDHRTHIAIP